MNAEIITIGDELLLGQVIDTNSAWLGLKLADSGIAVSRRTAVGDDRDAIVAAISEARQRVSLLFITGGLGPTRDDITKKTLAGYFGSEMRTDPAVMEHLENIFRLRGRKLLDINRQQAEVPTKCVTLFNEVGTAPGMLFDEDGLVLVSVPGVPSEMKHIVEQRIIPWLPNRFTLPVIVHKTLLTSGIPESLLAENLTEVEDALPAHIKLAYLPAFNSIRLRLTGSGNDHTRLQKEMEAIYGQIADICGEYLVVREDTTLPAYIANLLIKNEISIALAESCTGGFVTNQLIRQPGISSVMKGAMVSYSNEIKIQELGVTSEILTTVGAVSEACAQAMVLGIQKKYHSDVAISTTGIAGPGGATEEKPVGLVYIGIAVKDKCIVRKFHFPGTREQFMERANNSALDLLRKEILQFYDGNIS